MSASVPSTHIITQMIGTTIDGRFRIDSLIKDSPMGAVFRATQIPIERPIILKVLHAHLWSDEGNLTRFMQEAQIISNLTHPNVVRLLDFDRREDMLYLAMEFIDGVTLSEIIDGHRLSIPLALEFAYQICGALSESHINDIVHRDLKPDNIMIVPMSDGTAQVKVVDFGVARAINTGKRATAAGIVCGTPAYMAPEQAQEAPVDGRTDLYAVGIILYEMLCGFVPFDAETSLKVILQQIQRIPEPLSSFMDEQEMPASLERFVLNLLAKTPEHRPRSANDVRREIEDLMDDLGTRRVRLPTKGEDLVARFDKWRLPSLAAARAALVHESAPLAREAIGAGRIKLPTLSRLPVKKKPRSRKATLQSATSLSELSVPKIRVPKAEDASTRPVLGLPKLDVSAALSAASNASEPKEVVAPAPVERPAEEPVVLDEAPAELSNHGFPAGFIPAQEAAVTSDSIPRSTLVGMPVLTFPGVPQEAGQDVVQEAAPEPNPVAHDVPEVSPVAIAPVAAAPFPVSPSPEFASHEPTPVVEDTAASAWMEPEDEDDVVYAPSRSRAPMIVALIVMVALVVGVVVLLTKEDPSPQPPAIASVDTPSVDPSLVATPHVDVEPDVPDVSPVVRQASLHVVGAQTHANTQSAQDARRRQEDAALSAAIPTTAPTPRVTPERVKARAKKSPATVALSVKPKRVVKSKPKRTTASKVKSKKLKRNLDWLRKR